MEKQMNEVKVSEMIVRTAVFMAGKVQAICSAKAKVDGFGRESYGNMRTVDFSVDFNKQ